MSVKENIRVNKFLHFVAISNVYDLFWILSFTILTALAAQITIPVKPVPFTLQTMMVVVSGVFLGARKGAYSQIIYLLLGCVGLPVFAQIPDNAIGIMRLFGPTGGYLLAFPIGAFLTGLLANKIKNYFGIVLSMFIGESIILLMGSTFLGAFYLKDMKEAFISGAVVFLIWAIVKSFIGASIYFGISKSNTKNKL